VQNEKARLEFTAGVDSYVGVACSEHRPSRVGTMMAMMMARDGVLHKASAYHIQLPPY
jgi:hypothetical protein